MQQGFCMSPSRFSPREMLEQLYTPCFIYHICSGDTIVHTWLPLPGIRWCHLNGLLHPTPLLGAPCLPIFFFFSMKHLHQMSQKLRWNEAEVKHCCSHPYLWSCCNVCWLRTWCLHLKGFQGIVLSASLFHSHPWLSHQPSHALPLQSLLVCLPQPLIDPPSSIWLPPRPFSRLDRQCTCTSLFLGYCLLKALSKL